MKLIINNDVTSIVPSFSVIAYSMDVVNTKTNEVTKYIDDLTKWCQTKYNIETITQIPKLKETRDGYKAFGKDPSHTRPACEALLRRLVKKEGIYRLGDIIDIGNIVSILTLRSVCVVDYEKLKGNINIRLGNQNDIYYGINRGIINVNRIPVYVDDVGPFGCPTSDTDRTKVTDTTKSILVMIICFSKNDIINDEQLMLDLYQRYAQAKNIKKIEVNYGKL